MNAEEGSVSRRSFLTTAGGVAVGLGIARFPGTASRTAVALAATAGRRQGRVLPTNGLDPYAVARRPIVSTTRKEAVATAPPRRSSMRLGMRSRRRVAPADNPWRLLPRGLYSYGSGGVVGWGTICGALNGAIAVMDILGVHGQLGNALIDYFCNSRAAYRCPGRLGAAAGPGRGPDTTREHRNQRLLFTLVPQLGVDVGRHGRRVGRDDSSKKDRCAKLVGDIVAKAVELMNARFQETPDIPAAWVPPASYATCYELSHQPQDDPFPAGQDGLSGMPRCRSGPRFLEKGKRKEAETETEMEMEGLTGRLRFDARRRERRQAGDSAGKAESLARPNGLVSRTAGRGQRARPRPNKWGRAAFQSPLLIVAFSTSIGYV